MPAKPVKIIHMYFRQLLTPGLLLCALCAFGTRSEAVPAVKCTAWMVNLTTQESATHPMKIAPYDAQYLTAKIGIYEFGADLSYLPDEGIGLIVYDNITHRFASDTVGFRRIGGTKSREATLTYGDVLANGDAVRAAVQCGYTEP